MKNSSTKFVTSFSHTNFRWNLTKMSSLLMFLNAIYAESFIIYNLIIFILMSNLILFNWKNSVKKELSFLEVPTDLSLPSFYLWAESNRFFCHLMNSPLGRQKTYMSHTSVTLLLQIPNVHVSPPSLPF